MSDYSVSSIDFCTQGFERLRCNNEILLVAYPTARQGANAICREILLDLLACDQGDFDYSAAKKAIRLYFKALAAQWKGANALSVFGRDAFPKERGEYETGCAFYVYLSIPEEA